MIEDTRSCTVLTRADVAEALLELETLRDEERASLVELEDATVAQARIAQLERLLASATVVDVTPGDGVAGLGRLVTVRDQAGRETGYELVGRRGPDAAPTQVTLASPVGQALVGARAGDDVSVELPNGRRKTLTVVSVTAR